MDPSTKSAFFEKNADFHGVQHFFSQSRRRGPGPGRAGGGPRQTPKFFKIIPPPPKFYSKKFFRKCSRKPQKNFGQKNFRRFPGILRGFYKVPGGGAGGPAGLCPAFSKGKSVHIPCTLGDFRVCHYSAQIPPGPGSAPAKRLQMRPGIQGPENPKFRNFGRKGGGANRAVSAAGGLVGTGGKCPGWHFPVCMNGRVSAAGLPKMGSKNPVFTHGTGPCPRGMQ